MARVTVTLPRLLAAFIGDVTKVEVEADTLRGALEALLRRYPLLRVHLFDESGAFRRHVLCFHNEENTRWLESLDHPLATGDVVTIMQAVSGGSRPPRRAGPPGRQIGNRERNTRRIRYGLAPRW